jgi:hypothetical protein
MTIHSCTPRIDFRGLVVFGGPETAETLRSQRNRALLSHLIGCGLRRAEVTTLLFDLSDLITELSGSGVWTRGEVYASRRHLATSSSGTTYFIQSDWLGTERARALTNGDQFETCVNLPFGDGQTCTGAGDGRVWIGNFATLDALHDGSISSIGRTEGLPGEHPSSLFEDHAGSSLGWS